MLNSFFRLGPKSESGILSLPFAIMAGPITYHSKLFSILIVSLITIPTAVVMASPPPVKAAYWPSWATSFPPSAIDTSLFTHIYYAFLMPSNATYKFEISTSTALVLSDFTTTLHHKNPPAKTLFSIGGGGADPLLFSRMASDAKSRKAFINSAIEVARKYGFDGMDLDWEFPKTPKDMQDLGLLFMDWRRAINYEARTTHRAPLLLTAAVYFSVDFFLDEVYRKYPVYSINQNLDWVNAMCFDYHGGWDTSQTGAHAALYDSTSNISTSYGLRSWIKAGLPRGKLVMGLPLYGRTWQLKDPKSHEIGSAAVAVGPGEDGVLTFVQVEAFNKNNGAKVEHDIETVSTYSYVGSNWIGYDDAISTTLKIGFAQALGIRGYFFWALSYDSDWKISKQASRAWILGE
ncbi:hypothetical protein COLO4_18757 [Corchorus olitorius]|uniref:GH18 domain-containing protein n=1 Tax=Corchorus olitorius TaxID=93759 RepID=A0A1R3J7X9_9ROSI|nr:hypothetical protein COLO4_18757 [Corchorus olitorius]